MDQDPSLTTVHSTTEPRIIKLDPIYTKPEWLKTLDFLQWNFWHYDIIVISMNYNLLTRDIRSSHNNDEEQQRAVTDS